MRPSVCEACSWPVGTVEACGSPRRTNIAPEKNHQTQCRGGACANARRTQPADSQRRGIVEWTLFHCAQASVLNSLAMGPKRGKCRRRQPQSQWPRRYFSRQPSPGILQTRTARKKGRDQSARKFKAILQGRAGRDRRPQERDSPDNSQYGIRAPPPDPISKKSGASVGVKRPIKKQ